MVLIDLGCRFCLYTPYMQDCWLQGCGRVTIVEMLVYLQPWFHQTYAHQSLGNQEVHTIEDTAHRVLLLPYPIVLFLEFHIMLVQAYQLLLQ